MAWSWGHTQEAYNDAKRNMEALSRETREIIAAEWMGTLRDKFGGYGFSIDLDMKRYRRGERRAKRWTDEKLNDMIWKNMSDYATCTNGGWEAYCCPHGCGPHMVPFGSEQEEDDEL